MLVIALQPHQTTSDSVERASGGAAAGLLTIDECVENVLPVLLHQVVNVSEDTTVSVLALHRHLESRGIPASPHDCELVNSYSEKKFRDSRSPALQRL